MVAHHNLPSPRPSLVHESYFSPRNTKGKLQGSPSEFPPITAVSVTNHRHNNNKEPSPCDSKALIQVFSEPDRPLTSAWTEAIFLVLVKVVSGGTPAIAVVASFHSAAVVGLPQEDEGEHALCSVGIPSKRVKNCEWEEKGLIMAKQWGCDH